MANSQGNPCTCITKCCGGATNTIPCPPTPKGDEGCCLKICDGIVAAQDAVGPCGQAGTLDLITLAHNFDCCVNAPVISVVEFDEIYFSSVEISGTNLLWTTADDAPVQEYGEIMIKACCKTEDGDVLTHYSCQKIGIKNLCECPDCPGKCSECDKCTGECMDKAGEIKISQSMGGKISVK